MVVNRNSKKITDINCFAIEKLHEVVTWRKNFTVKQKDFRETERKYWDWEYILHLSNRKWSCGETLRRAHPKEAFSFCFPDKMSKLEDLEFPYCRDAMAIYEKLAKIGQGTFGYVHQRCWDLRGIVYPETHWLPTVKFGFGFGLIHLYPALQTLVTPREVGPNSQVSKVANNSPVTPGRETHSNLGAIWAIATIHAGQCQYTHSSQCKPVAISHRSTLLKGKSRKIPDSRQDLNPGFKVQRANHYTKPPCTVKFGNGVPKSQPTLARSLSCHSVLWWTGPSAEFHTKWTPSFQWEEAIPAHCGNTNN